MTTWTTLPDLLQAQNREHVALTAPGRLSLTFGELCRQVRSIGAALGHAGIGPEHRVAIVLPNGPEMVTVFLGAACRAIAAPLNPGYRRDEFSFYLEDLGARVLIVQQGSESEALAAAHGLDIPVLEVAFDSAAAAGTVHFPEVPDANLDLASPEGQHIALRDTVPFPVTESFLLPQCHGSG